MSKVRIYELGKELGVQNAALIDKARELGLDVESHLSYLEEEDALKVRSAMATASQGTTVEKRVSSTVIRRRSRRQTTEPDADMVEAEAPLELDPVHEQKAAPEPEVTPEFRAVPEVEAASEPGESGAVP
ncbi:MAG: translation initiation factor IF-2 N-terminal domain-containing protein, partial [Pseudomonadota bacterium]